MPTEVRIGLLVVGAVLVLAALASLALRVPRTLRVLLGLFGIGLLAWGITLQLLTPASPSPAASSAASPVTNSATSPAESSASTSTTTPSPPAAASGGSPTTAPPPRPDLTLLASSAFADCGKPADPAAPPDGTRASKAQMLAAQQTMKAYDAGVTAYTKCVDAAASRLTNEYQGLVPVSEIAAVRQLDIRVHNNAVDQDTQLVGRFNQQLRIFLAKQRPAPSPLPPAP
jgi:hypothetical protein